ncbi:MAG: hypothetical protein RXR01_06805 [Thermoproteus sp.]
MEKQNSTQNTEITIKTKTLGSAVSDKGRVKIEGFSLDVNRIKKIFYLGGYYYIQYKTDNADFYKQYMAEPPPLAVALRHQVKEEKVYVCSKCGAEIEWDADEPFCPRGCDEEYDDWSYDEKVRRTLVVEAEDEVRQFVEKLFGVRAEQVDRLWRNIAGGFVPQFDLVKVDVQLYKAHIIGVAVAENPAFQYSDYDSVEATEKKFEGRYIVVEQYSGGGREFLVFRFEGEPDTSALQRLHEEYRKAEEEQKERRKRLEEEEERRRREEEEKWGDPAKVAEAIRAALPEWADGAVVLAKSVCDEDCDVYYYVYPVKRSTKRAGEYYTSREWRQLKLEVPDRFLEKLAGYVIARDGSAVKVKEEKEAGKYLNLRV